MPFEVQSIRSGGKTPVLTATETRMLLDSIETDTLVGLRDRALIGVMVYSLGRVSAVVGLAVADYYTQGKRSYLRLQVPAVSQKSLN